MKWIDKLLRRTVKPDVPDKLSLEVGRDDDKLATASKIMVDNLGMSFGEALAHATGGANLVEGKKKTAVIR